MSDGCRGETSGARRVTSWGGHRSGRVAAGSLPTPGKIAPRLVSALLVGLLAFFTPWSALAGAHPKKAGVIHTRYYLYEPPQHSRPSVARPHDDHEMCWLPSEGCDNNHTITN